MRLRMTASVLTVLCAWVLWEKAIFHDPGQATQRLVEAIAESKTLEECRAALRDSARKKEALLSAGYKEPDFVVQGDDSRAFVVDKRYRKDIYREYVYFCLPPTPS